MLAISSLSVGCRNIVPTLSLQVCPKNVYVNILWAFFVVSAIDAVCIKVIIKDASSIIGIGYSINIINGQEGRS